MTDTSPGAGAWIVTVRDDDGVEHDVEVIADPAHVTRSASLEEVHNTAGTSVVQATLAADPTRIPTRITCGAEGSQPEYND